MAYVKHLMEFDKPVDKVAAEARAAELNHFGYHPAGYGGFAEIVTNTEIMPCRHCMNTGKGEVLMACACGTKVIPSAVAEYEAKRPPAWSSCSQHKFTDRVHDKCYYCDGKGDVTVHYSRHSQKGETAMRWMWCHWDSCE